MTEDYVTSIIKPLLLVPEAMKVTPTEDERGLLISIDLARPDMGRIIGKAGETIKSIRTIVNSYGGINKLKISIKINEPLLE